ncbi:MAG: methionine synthase [Deltaproteobacteria bacterium]|nr:methionine synthase [Deltaproteobacteria bacterium]
MEVPLKRVLTRLGYRSSKTVLSGRQREKLEETIAASFALCEIQGCWRRIPIVEKNNDGILLEGGALLKSRSLADLLKDSLAVVMMASTAGPAIVEAAADAMVRGDGATAVILDAVGGQSADAAMSWINEFVRGQVSRSAERLTPHRFSPGFGDFSLENQKLFHALLELDRLGLQLTSRFMLVPEKSVTAVAGIEPAFPSVRDP